MTETESEPKPNLVQHPAQRATDHSTIAKINYWFALRGFIMWAGTVIGLLLTLFTFTKKWDAIPDRIVALEHKTDTLKFNQLVILKTSAALVKLQCFNPAYSGDQLWAVGLDNECSSLYLAAEARRRVINSNGHATQRQRDEADAARLRSVLPTTVP